MSERILGIDPGIAITGFGILEKSSRSLSVVSCGCIRTLETFPDTTRLHMLAQDLESIVREFSPDCASVEKLFVFHNLRSVIHVSQARGVILECLERLHISVFEYTPLQVKQAMTGYGRAKKDQVQRQVKTVLGLKSIPQPDDVADALAIACCHAQTSSFLKACSGR